MKIIRMPIRWIAIVFFGLFQISIQASSRENYRGFQDNPVSDFADSVIQEANYFAPIGNSTTKSILGIDDFDREINNNDVVIAYFMCRSPSQYAIENLKYVIDTKKGVVRLLLIESTPGNEPIFTKFGVKYDALEKDTILQFKGHQLRELEEPIRGVTALDKLTYIVNALLYTAYIHTEADYESFKNQQQVPKVMMIFDDGLHADKVKKIQKQILEKEGENVFIGIVNPNIMGTREKLCDRFDLWQFPTVFRYEGGMKKGEIACAGSITNCLCYL